MEKDKDKKKRDSIFAEVGLKNWEKMNQREVEKRRNTARLSMNILKLEQVIETINNQKESKLLMSALHDINNPESRLLISRLQGTVRAQ